MKNKKDHQLQDLNDAQVKDYKSKIMAFLLKDHAPIFEFLKLEGFLDNKVKLKGGFIYAASKENEERVHAMFGASHSNTSGLRSRRQNR